MSTPSRYSKALTIAAAIVVALALTACQRVMAPTPTIVAQTPDPYANVAPERRTTSVPMLYVTDRAFEPTKKRPVWYGYGRSSQLSFGVAEVRFGKDLTWEELVEATSTSKRKKEIPMSIGAVTELGRLPSNIPALHYADGQYRESDEIMQERQRLLNEFYKTLSERLAATSKKDVYIFVHGYHNTFEDSMYAISQLWHYAGREGVPIVYSWPAGSPGLLRGYTHDRESGEYTVYHLKSFIAAVAKTPGLERLHLIGHSRGTDVLITAVRELHIGFSAAGKSTREELKLENLMLAAPDLDGEVTSQRIIAERLYNATRRFTIYVSPTDEAIGTADWLFSSNKRVGQVSYDDLRPETKASLAVLRELNVIDVTLRTSGHGHSYFYDQPQVSSDVLLLLSGDRPPGAEYGRPLIEKAPGWWELDKDYLLKKPAKATEP